MQLVRHNFARGLGYSLACLNALLIPAHSNAPCEVSAAIFGVSVLTLFFVVTLSCLASRPQPNRFRPARFALLTVIGHMLSVH